MSLNPFIQSYTEQNCLMWDKMISREICWLCSNAFNLRMTRSLLLLQVNNLEKIKLLKKKMKKRVWMKNIFWKKEEVQEWRIPILHFRNKFRLTPIKSSLETRKRSLQLVETARTFNFQINFWVMENTPLVKLQNRLINLQILLSIVEVFYFYWVLNMTILESLWFQMIRIPR